LRLPIFLTLELAFRYIRTDGIIRIRYPYHTIMSDIREILLQGALTAGPALLGMTIRVNGCSARIVEVEAYLQEDPASHSYRGPTRRNAPMFLAAGHLYVYRSYGVHWCLNLVTGAEGVGEAVLIRSAEPLDDIPAIRCRRGDRIPEHRLLAGPGNLCAGLGIDGSYSGEPLGLRLTLSGEPGSVLPIATPRIGISKAQDRFWRFVDPESRSLSQPVRRRRDGYAAEGSANRHSLDSTRTSR
jgi:DNA-3-methyladenine glycosylase